VSSSSDNPIGNIFDNVMGFSKPKNVSEYLDRMRGLSDDNTPLSYLLQRKDKYNIFGRARGTVWQRTGSKADPITPNSYQGSPFEVLSPNRYASLPGVNPTRARMLQKYNLHLAHSSSLKEMYLLGTDGWQGALPIQEGGLVHTGGSVRGAYRLKYTDSLGEETYHSLFYQKLDELIGRNLPRGKFLREFRKINESVIGTGVKGKLKLGALLGSPVTRRGSDIGLFNAQSHELRMRVVDRPGASESDIISKFKQFKQDTRTINLLVKTKGNVIPDYLPDSNALTAFDQARRGIESFHEWLPSMYARLGISGMHQLAKADYLTGQKGLVLPSSIGKEVFGSFASIREQTKGLFQEYNRAYFTKGQREHIFATQGSPIASFMTAAEDRKYGPWLKRKAKIAIVDFKSMQDELLTVGDSGFAMTYKGSVRAASHQYIGSLRIAAPDQLKISAVEDLLGVSNPRGIVKSAVPISFTKKELERARWSRRYAQKNSLPTFYKWGDLTEKERALRVLARSKSSGVLDAVANHGGSVFATVTHKSGKLSIDFLTSRLLNPGTAEMLVGGLRMTGTTTTADSPIHTALNTLADKHGVELVISGSSASKMRESSIITGFLHEMEEQGKLDEAIKILGGNKGNTTYGDIPVVKDFESAHRAALQYIKDLEKSKIKKNIKIAARMRRGKQISAAVFGLQDIAHSVSIFNADISLRADATLDMNSVNPGRITPGKMKTIALAARLRGHSNPYNDVVFRTLANHWKSSHFGYDHSTMDFRLGSESPILKWTEAINGSPISHRVEDLGRNLVISRHGNKVWAKGANASYMLKTPRREAFRMSADGMSYDELSNTILDRRFRNKMAYLDLGKEMNLDLLGQNKSIRYLPIPLELSRVSATDHRVIMDDKHPFASYMDLLREYSANGSDTQKFAKLARTATEGMYKSILGKDGLLAKTNIIHLKNSLPFRLTAQRGNYWNKGNMFSAENFYDIQVSRKQFSAEALKKMGYSEEDARRLIKSAKVRKSMYVMLGADPAQRPEHIGQIWRLVFNDSDNVGKDFRLTGATHPIAQRMLERDNDMDKLFLHFIGHEAEKAEGIAVNRQFASIIEQQKKAVAPVLNFVKSEIEKDYGKSSSGRTAILKDIMEAYTGQKTWASLGYTITRPDERLIHTILTEGAEGLKAKGISLGTKAGLNEFHIQQMRAALGGEAYAPAMVLSQYLYQGGVTKGGVKGSLLDLSRALIETAQKAKTQDLDLDEAFRTGKQHILDFIEGSDKNRLWATTEYLVNKINRRSSTPLVLQGLAEGSAEMANARKAVFDEAADLMSKLIFGSAAIHGAMGRGVSNLTAVMEDRAPTEGPLHPRSVWNRFIAPVLGFGQAGTPPPSSEGAATQVLGTATGPTVTPAESPTSRSFRSSFSEIGENLLSNFKSISKSKYLWPSVGGLAAIGAYGYMSRPDLSSSDMPPPMDVSMPTDRGPDVPDYSNVARVNNSRPIAPASRLRKQFNYNQVSTSRFPGRSSSNVIIEDRTSPTSPWLIRQQMQKVSESDFVR